MPRTRAEESKPPVVPQQLVPKYQRSPKRGQLCFELLMREYIHLWLKHNKISQQFYCKAKQELDELKKTRYAKTVAAQKPDPTEVAEVENLPSTPPTTQRHNTLTAEGSEVKGKENRKGQSKQKQCATPPPNSQRSEVGKQQNHQSTVQVVHQHQRKNEAVETKGVADPAFVTEQKLTLQIINLQNANKELSDENNRLYAQVSSLDIENRDLEDKIENMKTQLRGAYENINDLRLRLSKLAGDNMRSNNPNLADLSDPYRPTELGKMFGEIYDNEWSDAFEVVGGETEKDKIDILYRILIDIYKFCRDNFTRQTEAIDACFINPALNQDQYPDAGCDDGQNSTAKKTVEFKTALKDRRKQLAPITAKQLAEVYSQCELPKKQGYGETERLPTKLSHYARKCCELCWFMVISDPPLVFSDEKEGHEFATDIFRPYTRSQKDMVKPVIEMVVWPALYLHFEGALLAKGVAQPISEKDIDIKQK